MSLSYSTQAQIAFKNIVGKAQTDPNKGVLNEFYGYSFNLPVKNLWADTISGSPVVDAIQGITVEVIADLVSIPDSNNHGFISQWPSSLPDIIDIRTGNTFSYNVGSLVGIQAGDRITDVISPYFGFSYSVIPYTNYPSESISLLDSRDWYFQYNSGIFYQDSPLGVTPSQIKLYPYIGNSLNISSSYENIRISATGTNTYYDLVSTPPINTLSTNYLFLVDFANANTSGTVSLSIGTLGTYSIKKNSTSGLTNLINSEIIGGTAGSLGPIYYLTFNGTEFLFYSNIPEQSTLSYNKPNSSNYGIGSLESGSSFQNVSYQNVFNNLLYGDELGNISNISIIGTSGYINPLEIGDSLVPSTYTFSWSLTNAPLFNDFSAKIERVGYGNIISSSTNSGPYEWILGSTISYNSTQSEIFNLYLTRTNGTTIRKQVNIDWRLPIYYGSTTSTNLLGSSLPSNFSKLLATNSNFVVNIPGSGYKYVAVPDSFSEVYSITIDGFPAAMAGTSNGFSFQEFKVGNYNGTISSIYHDKIFVTGSFGIGFTYSLYRTLNSISSGIYLISNELADSNY